MLRPRIIVCLDVDRGRVGKGVKFKGLRDVGDPVELAERYEAEGADEIVFLDVSASAEGRGTLMDTVRRTAQRAGPGRNRSAHATRPVAIENRFHGQVFHYAACAFLQVRSWNKSHLCTGEVGRLGGFRPTRV